MVFGGRRVGGDLNGLSQYMYILYNIYTHTATRTHTHVYLYIHLSNNNSSYFLYTLTEQPPLTPVVPFTEMLFFFQQGWRALRRKVTLYTTHSVRVNFSTATACTANLPRETPCLFLSARNSRKLDLHIISFRHRRFRVCGFAVYHTLFYSLLLPCHSSRDTTVLMESLFRSFIVDDDEDFCAAVTAGTAVACTAVNQTVSNRQRQPLCFVVVVVVAVVIEPISPKPIAT